MQVFQDVKRNDVVIVVFDFDELTAIIRESTKTERQISDVIKEVLASGFRIVKETVYCKVKDRS